MVDSNLLTREKILPSEKAWAYKVKMSALNHNGVKGEAYSYEIMTAQTGESKNTIFRLIRLTELTVALIDKVDAKKLSSGAAVELSYLSVIEQNAVADAMERHQVKPSPSQALRLKKMNGRRGGYWRGGHGERRGSHWRGGHGGRRVGHWRGGHDRRRGLR